MVRGLFDNRTLRNLLDELSPPGSTIHAPSDEISPLHLVAARYAAEHKPVVIIAGERFGMGSSRDWAAKGQALLGVRAVLALGFERIHRSNLIAMGILPLRLPTEAAPAELSLKPGDRIELNVPAAALAPQVEVTVTLAYADGRRVDLVCRAEVDTALEVDQLRAGGVIPLIMQDFVSSHLFETR